MWSAGTFTLSKKIEPRPTARVPTSSNAVRVRPGKSIGTRKALMPRAPSASLPVRANTTATSDWSASEIEVFSPLRMKSSPLRTALSFRRAASDPALGSVSAIATSLSPARIGLSQRVFRYSCACVEMIWPHSEVSRLM